MAEPLLERGSEGPAVKDVQEALTALGFRPGEIDGVFGIYTHTAVRSFQRWARLTADGVVGPETWERLYDATKSDELLREGSAGMQVRRLQRALTFADLDVGEIDGRFGPKTEAALREFQERNELAVDGVVGPATWERLSAFAPTH